MNTAVKMTCVLSLLLLLHVAAPCNAAMQEVTLSQCIELSRPVAEEIKLAEEALFSARQDRIRARSAFTPNFELTASYAGAINDMDGASSPPTHMKEKTLSGFLGIGFQYTFYLNGRELIAYKAAGELITKSEEELKAARRDYTLQVATAFFRGIQSKRSVRIAESNLTRLKAHREAVRQRIEAGLLTKTERYRSEAQLSEGDAALTKAKSQLAINKSRLKRLVPLPADFSMVDEKSNIPKAPSTELSDALTMALANRPEIIARKIQEDVAAREVALTRSLFWPKVTIEGAAGIQNDSVSGSYDATDDRFHRETDAYNAKVSLSLPLVDGGLRRADLRKTLSRARAAALDIKITEKEIRFQVEEAWYNRLTQLERVTSLEKNRAFSLQFLEAVTQQFKEGLTQSLDLLDANTRLVEAENTLEEARFALTLASITLRHATGISPAPGTNL